MTQKRGWVWWSDRESIEAEKISFQACVETVLAVIASLVFASWTGWYWQIVISLAVAPLVLLQSESSIRDAHSGFRRYVDAREEPSQQTEIGFIAIFLICGGVLWFFIYRIFASDSIGREVFFGDC